MAGRKNFILSFLIAVCIGLSYGMFHPLFSVYAQLHGISVDAVGIIVGIATVLCLFGRMLAGGWYQAVNRKKLLTVPLAMMGAAYVILLLSAEKGLIVVAESLQVIGMGAATIIVSTIAVESSDTKNTGMTLGLFNVGLALAQSIAPSIGSFLFRREMYQTIFLLAAAVMGAALLLTMMLECPPEPAGSSKGVFRLSNYISVPTLPVVILLLFYCIVYAAVYNYTLAYGVSAGITGIDALFTVCFVTMLMARLIAGRMADRTSALKIMVPGYLLIGAGVLLLSQADSSAKFYISAALSGAGFGAVQICMQFLAIRSVEEDHRNVANSTYYMGGDLGLAVGAMIAGDLAVRSGYRSMYLVMSLFTLAGLVSAVYLVVSGRIRDSRFSHTTNV